MPYPLPLTRTEAYLAYKAGVIQQSDLKPSLAIPRNGIDAWLAYWTGLSFAYPVKNVGKNILSSSWETGAYSESTGEKTGATGYRTTDKIAVKPNTAYIVSRNSSGLAINIGLYKNDGTFITRLYANADASFSTTSDTAYITMWRGSSGGIDKMMLEEGESISQYAPYTGEPLILQEEEAYIAYLCGVINEYPEKCLRRVGAYLRYLISARWGRPDHPLNREELYLSLIKTQFIPSGDPSSDIVIDGTAKAPFVDVKMYGDTFQQTYTGKNLIPFVAPSVNTRGLTVTADIYSGAITFGGTTDAGYPWVIQATGLSLPAGTYTFSIDHALPYTLSLRLYETSSSYPKTAAIQAGQTSATVTTTYTIMQVVGLYGASTSGIVVSNTTIYPQFELNSSATSFEPFVGGQPSPSPDYPQPIQTVTGRQVVKVEGKNKYPFNDTAWSSTSTRTTWFFQDGAINAYGADVTDKTNYKITLPAGIYTMTAFDLSSNIINIQACANGESSEIIVTSPSNINSGNLSSTITLTETTTLCVRYLVTTPSLGIGNTKIQIEKGTATAYEPYSSNDYEINLGKNLFDATATPWYRGRAYDGKGELAYWTGYVGIVGYQPVEPNSTYTFSNSTGKAIYYGLVFYDADKNKISYVASETRTFTTPANCHYVRFAIQNNSAPTWTQLEAGSTATDYAPYFEPIELCKLGTYQDFIWKDGEDWKVHKAVGEMVFDGSNDESWQRQTQIGLYIGGFSGVGRKVGLANLAGFVDSTLYGSFWDIPENKCGLSAIGNFGIKTSSYDVPAWRTLLASSPLSFYYALATPTDTVITNQNLIDQLNALKQGGAEEGTTYIKVNATDPNLPGLLYVEAPKYE